VVAKGLLPTTMMMMMINNSGNLRIFEESTGGCFLGVKRQGREADHSPPSDAEVKNGGAIPLFPCAVLLD
jgi:hypothetical protein